MKVTEVKRTRRFNTWVEVIIDTDTELLPDSKELIDLLNYIKAYGAEKQDKEYLKTDIINLAQQIYGLQKAIDHIRALYDMI